MSVVVTKFEVDNTVRHAAHGVGVIQKIFAEDRAFVKFIAPTADGDTEDVVLLEDLQLIADDVGQSSSQTTAEPTLEDRANISLKYDIPGIPLGKRSKATDGVGATEATLDRERIAHYAQTKNKESNWGLVAQAREGGAWILDCDSPEVAKLFKKETGEDMPKTLTVRSSQGGHRYFRQNAVSLSRLKNFSVSTPEGKEFFSVRWNNQYAVGPLSVHEKTGKLYSIVSDVMPAEAPEFLIDWLLEQHKKDAPRQKALSEPDGGLIPNGLRDITLTSIAGKQRNAGSNEEDIYQVLSRINDERCETPLSDDQVRKIARSIGAKPDGTTLSPTVTIGGAAPGAGVNAPLTSADTITEIAVRTKNIHITYSEDVFYGLAGKIIKKLQPETESHPIGNLLELLASFGNIVGPTAHYMIEDTRHYTNINVVKVGKSSKSRKGTGKARIERIASQLDLSWFTSRNISGLGSGEAVIWDIRDPVMGPSKNKTTGEVTLVQIDPGVSDKRLYISEGEFSGVLAVAGRKDSILSTVIRNAWDHKPLRNKVKGSPAVCLNPHVSISADITRDELLNLLSDSDQFNGFGNRFLWCFVDRQGLKPHGGEDIDWSKEIIDLYRAVEFTKKQSRIFMDRNAREMWNRIYEELSEDVDGGVIGAVTGRGEAQVIRLALIFAMLDLSDHIQVEHLKAARALWQYCEDSARIIFGGVLKTHQRILDFIKEGPKTVREIQDVLFTKHRKVSEIEADLNTLSAVGRVYTKQDEAGVERYYSVES